MGASNILGACLTSIIPLLLRSWPLKLEFYHMKGIYSLKTDWRPRRERWRRPLSCLGSIATIRARLTSPNYKKAKHIEIRHLFVRNDIILLNDLQWHIYLTQINVTHMPRALVAPELQVNRN